MVHEIRCSDPAVDVFKCLLLDMARQRSVQALLHLIVDRLQSREDVAVSRIWLTDSSPSQQTAERNGQPAVLQLEVCSDETAGTGSSSTSTQSPAQRQIAIGEGLVGRIAATGEHLELTVLNPPQEWVTDPAWVSREGIRGLIGHPLAFQDQVLGVLLVFLRQPPTEEVVTWLRMIADHAATAIATARAFEEIERLRTRLEQENEYLREEVHAAQSSGEITAVSSAMARVLEQLKLVAPTDTSVLILGESGVGKELIARAIHSRSLRADRPMITVNCASIPRELFESEFFGHVRGSFTGAVRDRAGRFELADGGTLFLDEVGEIPLEMQGKLLRVLQEGTWERIGEEQTRRANVRIVAATNRNLEQEIAAGRFRQDLYYRLSVFPIEVLPLRLRKEDIPPLAMQFLRQHSQRLGLPLPVLRQKHMTQLQNYAWPGNIRELQNVIERAVIRSRIGPLQLDLPPDDEAPPAPSAATDHARFRSSSSLPPVGENDLPELLTDAEVRQFERTNLVAVLEQHSWKISGKGGAAEFLGLHPATLSSRLRSLSIRRPG
ncbi:MAG: sigma 54-interacting transcriptional regulator [Planctomycetaceae bacterium]|nr:sigma 54-interacting transcriptional regulator [Planctomycetaceae bacterium]